MADFTKDYLDFFIELAGNNNKDWFDINRKRYELSVKKPFQLFVQRLIDHFALANPAFNELTPSECIFRINRDIRFSKDKAPYKMMCSAVITPMGKKSPFIHGVYFELGPEAVRVYGGLYDINKDDLLLIREGIAENLSTFKLLKTAPEFCAVYGEIQGTKNKIIPKELRDAAEKEPLIFNKQLFFMAEFDAELILSDELFGTIITCYKAGEPLELFFNQFIQPQNS